MLTQYEAAKLGKLAYETFEKEMLKAMETMLEREAKQNETE